MAKIGFVSLGCPKALVDSERIITRLRAEGYQLVGSYEEADLVVVNTCGFIQEAVEESLEAIGQALAENGRVVVTGCLGQRASQIEERFPKVLAISGPGEEEVIEAIHRHLPPPHAPFLELIPPEGLRLTPRHYAYLKISEGCNNRCTFCIIPQLRGRLRSRPIDEVLLEAERLVEAGVKEILVISQDTGAYGRDLDYLERRWRGRKWRTHIVDLARALGELGVWIRLHYLYPYPHIDQLIPLMAEGKILPYLDVPLQHASPTILKAMRRPARQDKMLRRIERWREICPELTIRSTFIVGFPGETEGDFQELLDFLQTARLDRVGAFKYSPIEGAAANRLPDPVPEPLKEERFQELMELQSRISAERLRRKIGQVEQVLLDQVSERLWIGRTRGDAPEIDGVVYIEPERPDPSVQPGAEVAVEMIHSDQHDLWGRLFP